MSEIPADVMAAAKDVWRQLADFPLTRPQEEALIASAILAERLAERERCAEAADDKARDLRHNELSARKYGHAKEAEGYAYASEHCAEVASAIRHPQQGDVK